MKDLTKPNLAIRSGLALALALASWSPAHAQSPNPAAEGKTAAKATMMEQCGAMKEKKQKLQEDIKAQDARLTERLAEMNSAPNDRKVNLMAGVVTQMAEQQISMNARKAKMEGEMMQHMMQHMQMGKESMAQCPMMKSQMDMSSPDAHQHHPDQK